MPLLLALVAITTPFCRHWLHYYPVLSTGEQRCRYLRRRLIVSRHWLGRHTTSIGHCLPLGSLISLSPISACLVTPLAAMPATVSRHCYWLGWLMPSRHQWGRVTVHITPLLRRRYAIALALRLLAG